MEDILQCPICYNSYDQINRLPRQLDCQHALCSECIPYMAKDTNKSNTFVECPLCKFKTFKRINDIPRSLLIIQLIDATKNSNQISRTQPSINSRTIMQPQNTGFSYNNNSNTRLGVQTLQMNNLPNNSYLKPVPVPSQIDYSYTKPSPPSITSPVISKPTNQWDTKTFLRSIFNEMDVNRDNSITASELQIALRRGQGSDFNLKTVELLMSKYDKNGDREISFDEFYDLYTNLNDEYENFLMTDTDDSGQIDANEFTTTMNNKGYYFSFKFFKFIVDEISKHTGINGIKFDNYIR
jgi:Ca2+-binding EF-hand superfamily protein